MDKTFGISREEAKEARSAGIEFSRGIDRAAALPRRVHASADLARETSLYGGDSIVGI